MKFNCDWFKDYLDRTEKAKYAKFVQDSTHWKPWFAWRPVRVAHGDCRWFETVERFKYRYAVSMYDAFVLGYWEWRYRVPDSRTSLNVH